MVSTYNSKAAAAGIDHSTCHAHEANLLLDEPYVVHEDGKRHEAAIGGEHFSQFDVCIVGLGFHHFENYGHCLRTLSERVKSGGTVGIIDLFPKEGVSHHRVLSSLKRVSLNAIKRAHSNFT